MSLSKTSSNLIPSEIIPIEKATAEFLDRGLPIVLEGGAKKWSAFKKWSVDYFTEKYGNVTVPLSNYRQDPYQSAQEKPNMKIKDYLSSAVKISLGQKDQNEDLYSAGWFFSREHCELLKDIQAPSFFRENWAEKLQKFLRFDIRSILFGHPKVESPLHTDSFFVSTYFGMIKGQKRMRLVSPEHSEYVHNGYNVFDPEKLKELEGKSVPVYECVIKEGDIVWFPPGWWHHVKNDNFTISVTTNFVAAQHFLPFEQQVRSTLLRPLLKLDQLRDTCVVSTNSSFDMKNVADGKFVELENKYIQHFQQVLNKSQELVQSLA